MKKCISVLLAITLLMASLGCGFVVFAANSVSVDAFVESVEELNEEEAEAEKTFEESVGSRVIVKALQKPAVFGDAEYFKGTFGKHIFQYATEEEALKAVEYYSSQSNVIYAVRDSIVNSYEVPYGDAMLGTQRAKEYIANNKIPTSSVKVAVIDTGIDFSNELFKDNPRIVDSGCNTTDSGTENSALDDRGHGSMCSEIVMDNTGDDVSIIGYKVLNTNGAGTNLWVATGIEKAVEDGVDVINLSLGGEAEPYGEETSIVLDDAVRFAIASGVIVVAASGNDGMNAKFFSPANVEGVITVGAIDKAGNHAYFSNYGDCVDFVAPGVQLSIDYSANLIDGTSFASPYLVAEIGTLLSVYPSLSRNETVERLKTISVPYEHLTYHDGFHPIYEDQGCYLYYRSMRLKYESNDNTELYYGNGMPQIDSIFYNGVRETPATFSVNSGHYIDEEFDLILSSSPNAEIYYTRDESYPTKENGIKFEGSIHLDELQSVRAVAISEDKAPSFFSAREYRMEYHVPESDFTFVDVQRKSVTGVGGGVRTYYNVITEYLGNRKNIIVPDTFGGKEVLKVDVNTPNTLLTSITVPDSCTLIGRYKYNADSLVFITANGLESLNCDGKYFSSLVEINAPNLNSIIIKDSQIRKLYLPNAVSIYANNDHCLKEVYAPSLIQIKSLDAAGYFGDCYSLEKFCAPKLEYIGDKAFWHCYKLKDFEMNNVKQIGSNSFAFTYGMKKLICPSLTVIKGIQPFSSSNVRYLFAPNLETCSYPIGEFNHPEFPSVMIVSSKITKFERDGEGYDYDPHEKITFFYHHDLDIYGTPNTYAEEYANQFHLKFIPLPLMESEPESMRASDCLSVDVLGFNLEYQWYGTNIADNRLGEAIEGANGETFNPDDFGADYDFYYCVIKSSDGDYHKTLVTGDRIRLDVNGDGVIDIADISVLLSMYGEAPAEPFQDFNGDGVIDVSEISLLLKSTVYGTKE